MPHIAMAARMRRRYFHRTARLRHPFAALMFGASHFRIRSEACHRWVSKQETEQQNASEFAQTTQLKSILRLF